MKIITNRFFILIAFLCNIINAIAKPHPPNPYKKPPPPGLPIDESILILFLLALLFGIYIIYKDQLKQKTPI